MSARRLVARSDARGTAAENSTSSTNDAERPRALTFWQVVGSTFAAAFGVQSRANKVRDFSRANALQFVIAGIAFTAVFVIVMVVNLVLSYAT